MNWAKLLKNTKIKIPYTGLDKDSISNVILVNEWVLRPTLIVNSFGYKRSNVLKGIKKELNEYS